MLARRGGDLKPISEPYVQNAAPAVWNIPAPLLGPDQYLTLGDNWGRLSGRVVHIVKRGDIVGVLYKVVFPPWRARTIE